MRTPEAGLLHVLGEFLSRGSFLLHLHHLVLRYISFI